MIYKRNKIFFKKEQCNSLVIFQMKHYMCFIQMSLSICEELCDIHCEGKKRYT